jgi:hypothetical protein
MIEMLRLYGMRFEVDATEVRHPRHLRGVPDDDIPRPTAPDE